MKLLQVCLLQSRRSFVTNASVKLNTLQENIKYFKNIYGESIFSVINPSS